MANLAQQYANQAGANTVYKGPVFSQVLPYYEAFNRFKPYFQQEAESQVNPFATRALNQQLRGAYGNLASGGGYRFGRAMGNIGSIKAEAERNRISQLLDYINQKEEGFKQLFYNPTEQSFNRAIELGQKPTTPRIPTWDELQQSLKTGQPIKYGMPVNQVGGGSWDKGVGKFVNPVKKAGTAWNPYTNLKIFK